MNDEQLPADLAVLCNDLWIGEGTVCQGFVYDADSGIASFLYGKLYTPINLSAQPTACNRPGASMWLLKGGLLSHFASIDVQNWYPLQLYYAG